MQCQNPLLSPKTIAQNAVANHPAILESQKDAIAALIEATIIARDKSICRIIQEKLGTVNVANNLLRKELEAMLRS